MIDERYRCDLRTGKDQADDLDRSDLMGFRRFTCEEDNDDPALSRAGDRRSDCGNPPSPKVTNTLNHVTLLAEVGVGG